MSVFGGHDARLGSRSESSNVIPSYTILENGSIAPPAAVRPLEAGPLPVFPPVFPEPSDARVLWATWNNVGADPHRIKPGWPSLAGSVGSRTSYSVPRGGGSNR